MPVATTPPPPPGAGFRPDLLAGLTAAAVVLPKAMAYATVAGLPASVGLYTAFVPMAVYALIGSSRVLSVSSTTTLAILAGTQLALAVPDGDPARLAVATATLTALTGALLVAAAVLRLGFVANFISVPVLTGFKAGIGLVIVLDQVPKLLGLHITKAGFFRDVLTLVQELSASSGVTLAIGAGALGVLVLLERARPHSPAPLAVVGGGIALSWLMGLQGAGVATVGLIPQALPGFSLPDLGLVAQLAPGALGIGLMSFTESIAAARAFTVADDPPLRPDRELLALGAANFAGALFGAMPAGGGTSQTSVVRAVGGRSQRASLVTAAMAGATMLVLAPLLGLLPQAVLAAIVIVYSVGLIRPDEFRAIFRVRRMEFYWAMAAFLGVLVFGTLQGIVVAVVLSLVGLSYQAARPRVDVIGRLRGQDVLRVQDPVAPQDEVFEGLLMLRPEGRLFFVNSQEVDSQLRALIARFRPRVVVVDFSRVIDIEYSALQMIIEAERRMTAEGLVVWIADLNPEAREVVELSGFAAHLGKERLLPNLRAAIRAYQALPGAAKA